MAKQGDERGKVNLNTAGEEQLTRIEGVDGARARLIIEHREQHGPFGSWEAFEAVVGIGPALVEKAKQSAELGGGEGRGRRPGGPSEAAGGAQGGGAGKAGGSGGKQPAGGEAKAASGAEEEEQVEEIELDVSPLELVSALARLDLEAALAYEAAADVFEDEDVARQLRGFAQDHHRHVEGLNGILQGAGEEVVAPPPGVPVLTGLVKLAGPLGPDVVIVTLLGNEQLTNLSYDGALAYEWDDDVEDMLQAFQADEERHLQWLSDEHDRIGGHSPEAEQPATE